MRLKIENALKKLSSTGFFHVFGSSVINKVISFLSGIILVRILTKQEYGIYSYADNILSFCALLTGFGIASGVLQIGSETRDEKLRADIYRYGCRFGLVFNLGLALFIFVVAEFVQLPIRGAGPLLALMCGLPLFQLLSELQRTYLRTTLNNKAYAYSNTFSTAVTFVSSCVLAFMLRAEGLVLAHYFAAIITFLFIVRAYKVPFSLATHNTIEKKLKKDLLQISGISMLNGGLSKLMYLLDVFVLGIIIPNETVVASYKIATTIPTALIFIPSSVIVYVYPYFARNKDNKQWLKTNYRKLTFIMGIVNTVIAFLLFVLAPFIVKIVFGEQYLDAVTCFRILSISYAFSGTFRIIAGNILVTQRKLKFNLLVAVMSSLLNTVLNVFLIQQWGSEGAAIATIVTVIVTSIANVIYLMITFERIPEVN